MSAAAAASSPGRKRSAGRKEGASSGAPAAAISKPWDPATQSPSTGMSSPILPRERPETMAVGTPPPLSRVSCASAAGGSSAASGSSTIGVSVPS